VTVTHIWRYPETCRAMPSVEAPDGVGFATGQSVKGPGMKKAMIGTLFLLVAALVPLSARAQIGVSVGVNVPLPPPIVFSGPPQVVVLPESNVYVAPDVEADIFFSQGWWWRPWEGRWYRSRQYDRGWGFYRAAPPPFYRNVPPGWRNDYREHRWHGREWNHERIPHGEMERNWRGSPRPLGPRGNPQRMERKPEGPMQMRGPQGPHGQPRQDGRGYGPGPQGPRGGGPMGGPNRGPSPGRGNENRGGHGRR